MNLVSLGMSCQTTHQIDFFSQQNPQAAVWVKSPFDWLICSPDSAARWLAAGLCSFTPGDITERLEHAFWPRFSFWFWHGFIDRSGDQAVLDLTGMAENELSKLNHLRQNFCSLDVSRTLFVVSNTQNNLTTEVFEPDEQHCCEFSADSIDKLQVALDQFFARPVALQVVTRTDRAESRLLQRDNVMVLPADDSNWKGNRQEWGKLLAQFLH